LALQLVLVPAGIEQFTAFEADNSVSSLLELFLDTGGMVAAGGRRFAVLFRHCTGMKDTKRRCAREAEDHVYCKRTLVFDRIWESKKT
jgi:hypothetical protein